MLLQQRRWAMKCKLAFVIALVAIAAVAIGQAADVDGLIGKLSDGNADVRLAAARELGTLGPGPLAKLLALVGGDDQRVAAGARLAVEGIVGNLTAPNAPAGRDQAAQALLGVAQRSPIAARRFALRQLALIGRDESVTGLAKLLGDADVGEMARWALAHIPGQAATEALIAAVANPDVKLRAGALNALGERGDASALRALMTAAGDEDAEVRVAAVQALARIPATEGVPLTWQATGRGDEAERRSARGAYVLLGETLLAAGKTAEAADMLSRAYAEFTVTAERCAALSGWAKASGEAAVPKLIEVVRTGPRDERGVAQQALAEMEGAPVTEAVGKAAGEGEGRANLIWVLGERGDVAAVPALTAALGAPEDEVRIAALEALAKLQDPTTAPPIIAALVKGSPEVRAAAEAALARIPRAEAATAIAEAMKGLPDDVRLSLARVLGLHAPRASDTALIAAVGDPSQDLRIVAIEALGRHQAFEAVPVLVKAAVSGSKKESDAASQALTRMTARRATQAMMDALGTSGPKERAAIVRALGARGDAMLTDLLVKSTEDKDEGVQVAALEGLGRLHDEKTAPVVLNLAKTGGEKAKAAGVLAYLEIGKALVEPDRAKAISIFHEALGLAAGDAEKSAALGCIASVGAPESLPLVRPLMEQGSDTVKRAAAGALVAIGEALVNAGETTQAQELLTGAIPHLEDRGLLRRAAAAMRAMGKPLALGAERGYLTEYWVLGPAGSREDLRKGDVLPTDARVDIAKPVMVGDQSRLWQHRPTDDPIGHEDFEQTVGQINDNGAYAYAEFEVPAAQDAVIKVGSDDDEVTWLNGKKVVEYIGDRGWNADQDAAEVTLQAGTNWVLSKVLNGGGQWALSVRLTDREGKPLAVKQWSKTPADIVALRGCLSSYWVLGPFAGREAMRTAAPVEPTAPIDLAQPVKQGDETQSWRWVSVSDVRGMLDLQRVLGNRQDVGCYLYAEVTSDKAQDVLLKIGSDDDVYCWLNGELVHENPAARPWGEDQDVVKARLQQGTNRILLKVLQGGGDWAASVRITDPQGNPLVLAQRKP
jgi:HEAT repeat protein